MADNTEPTPQEADYLRLARQLIEAVEQGRGDEAQRTVDELTRLRETELFRELGVLTRDLHEAMKTFRVDARIGEIAGTEIPDARERLNHVIELTDDAAHRTLSAIETSLPLVDGVRERSAALEVEWRRFRQRELDVGEFRLLSRDLEGFLGEVSEQGGQLQSLLTEALMAQGYQDLTGQIIRRVIALVQEVEDSLVALVRISGARMGEEKSNTADKATTDDARGHGPAVPGRDSGVVSGQDEVDDLLSSLGF